MLGEEVNVLVTGEYHGFHRPPCPGFLLLRVTLHRQHIVCNTGKYVRDSRSALEARKSVFLLSIYRLTSPIWVAKELVSCSLAERVYNERTKEIDRTIRR